MRISDWSSDVCSSDLEGLALAEGPVDLAALGAQLDAIAAFGYLVAESRDVVGVTDIGAPILDRDGRGLASIVVPYLNRHGSTPHHDPVLEQLLACCRGIPDALTCHGTRGWRPGGPPA